MISVFLGLKDISQFLDHFSSVFRSLFTSITILSRFGDEYDSEVSSAKRRDNEESSVEISFI